MAWAKKPRRQIQFPPFVRVVYIMLGMGRGRGRKESICGRASYQLEDSEDPCTYVCAECNHATTKWKLAREVHGQGRLP